MSTVTATSAAIVPEFDWESLLANIITEDDEPVDNMPSAAQQRLLVTPLYDSWTPPPGEDEDADSPEAKRKFMATANVGLFSKPDNNPLVPDMLLSLDVEKPHDWEQKVNRSYFIWHFGKPPDAVVEIVSNKEGHELDTKLKRYAQMDVTYYVVFDPQQLLSNDVLRVYERGFAGRRYRRRQDYQLPEIGLSLTLWEGTYEDGTGVWIRWCDAQGNLIETGAEGRAKAEAENERLRAELERLRKQLESQA
ncbi:MAG TPA: Uma2 family endonuclease [Blastocatellia bacterium]|nr:Uma2 family endonuclease [Blastocatellia bacterium]HMV82183.1 Uma2 family endonuclease [Blastocatellia bacterium]HMX30196.1 Uma2 family endonuclease [Blastocatellia bacterium]HMY73592.1 Uma2 family endonuclease [Blastocatellia bacterium]HMZ19190.1 Uma2 family endonuclease [Blastocatellia bacterium]